MTKQNRDADLGDMVRDKVTGFQGTITIRAKHLAGCDRFWVAPPVGSDGRMIEGQWLDIDLVEIVTPSAVQVIEYARKAPGGFDVPKIR
jgi:hypothetical protein